MNTSYVNTLLKLMDDLRAALGAEYDRLAPALQTLIDAYLAASNRDAQAWAEADVEDWVAEHAPEVDRAVRLQMVIDAAPTSSAPGANDENLAEWLQDVGESARRRAVEGYAQILQSIASLFDTGAHGIPKSMQAYESSAEDIVGAEIRESRPTDSNPPISESPISQSPITTRYTDIACPRRVWIGAERLAVVVRLTVAPPTRSAALQAFSVRVDAPVQIRLTAPAFDLLNAADQSTPILPDADSPPVVFDLKPRVVGPTSLVFDFRQAGNPVGTAVAPIEITSYEVVDAPESRGGAALQLPTGIDPPDLILTIHYDTTGAAPRLLMTLEETAAARVATFDPVPLRSDPAQVAAALYRDLSERAEVAGNLTDDAAFLAECNEEVQQIGFRLWRDLIPAGLKDLYLAQPTAWADKTLLVVSDEPHIPWELVWPYSPASGQADAAPWAVTLRLLRWLRRDAVSTGYAGPPAVIPLRRLACVAPAHTGLAHLMEERNFLRDLLRALGLEDVSPPAAQRRAVLGLLRQGGYDWLHIVAHGAPLDAESPPGAIELEDAHLLPGDLIGPQAEGYIYRVRPGFVLNICHGGRQTWGLTQLDGWANVLIGAGAGLVIAPRWAVTDQRALAFTQSFYRHLLGNASVAQAVYEARRAACAAGDPTWLAYSVYAHPQARAGY
ncbi:MAG TPA: CHAT domain-containing protein [Chloroflexi bacterium]|nr:CHAT domain-containing protein [Chloroflexota bacterium]